MLYQGYLNCTTFNIGTRTTLRQVEYNIRLFQAYVLQVHKLFPVKLYKNNFISKHYELEPPEILLYPIETWGFEKFRNFQRTLNIMIADGISTVSVITSDAFTIFMYLDFRCAFTLNSQHWHLFIRDLS